MARSYARFTTAVAEDTDWCSLPPLEQWLYVTILRSPKLSLAGCVDVKLRAWARLAAGLTEDQLADLLTQLEAKRYIAWDRDTDELVVRSFVKNDVFRTAEKTNQNTGRGMWSAWRGIESPRLRQFVVDNMPPEAFDERYKPLAEAPVQHGTPRADTDRDDPTTPEHDPEHQTEPPSEPSSDRPSEPPIEPPQPQPQPQPRPRPGSPTGSTRGDPTSGDHTHDPPIADQGSAMWARTLARRHGLANDAHAQLLAAYAEHPDWPDDQLIADVSTRGVA